MRTEGLRIPLALAFGLGLLTFARPSAATSYPPTFDLQLRTDADGECAPTNPPPLPIGTLIQPPRCGSTAGWESISGGRARVWWRTVDAKVAKKNAEFALDALEKQIWKRLAALAREPLSDRTEPCPDGKLPGGDAKLDLYLTNLAETLGAAGKVPDDRPEAATPYPHYILLDRNFKQWGEPYARHVVAHEFFHVLQAAYPKTPRSVGIDDIWWREATAEWAGLQVYPPLKILEGKLCRYLGRTDESLYTRSYAAVLFPWMLSQESVPPRFVAQSFENRANHDVLQAIDLAIPGGWKAWWPRFAHYAFNRAPWNQLEARDKIGKRARRLLAPITLDAEGYGSAARVESLAPLSVTYQHVQLPAEARTVGFLKIPALDPLPEGVSVEVLGRRPGETDWQLLEGWTSEGKVICRDRASERWSDLLWVFANSRLSPIGLSRATAAPAASPFELPRFAVATDVPCAQWSGSMAFQCTRTTRLDHGEARIAISALANVDWKLGEMELDERNQLDLHFFVDHGATTFARTLSLPGCTCGPMSRNEPTDRGLASLTIQGALAPQRNARKFFASGVSRMTADWGSCPCFEEAGSVHAGETAPWFQLSDDLPQPLNGGENLFGTFELPTDDSEDPTTAPRCEVRWDLKARRDA